MPGTKCFTHFCSLHFHNYQVKKDIIAPIL